MPVKPILFGGPGRIDDSAWQSTDSLFLQTGLNSGNLAFQYAIQRITGADTTVLWHAAGELDRHEAVAVIPCANQLGPHYDFGELAQLLKDVKTKFVVLGLGGQGNLAYDELPEIPQGTLDWLSVISAHAPSGEPNIGVRGGFTLRMLDHHGFGAKSTVLGCPSLFINPSPTLGADLERRFAGPIERIAVAAGHQHWRHLGQLEASLTRLINATGGAYIVQSPLEMFALARGDFDANWKSD